MVAETAFQVYGPPLTLVSSFKYLGQVLTAPDNDWSAVVENLRKEQWKWAQMSRILVRDREDSRTSSTFYKAVLPTLGGFHHRADCWDYSLSDEAMTIVVLEEMEMYVLHCQKTIAQYIATHIIL